MDLEIKRIVSSLKARNGSVTNFIVNVQSPLVKKVTGL